MAPALSTLAAAASAALYFLAPSAHGFAPLRPLKRRAVSMRDTYDVTIVGPDGETNTFPCADDEFILDAAEEAGFELPASCRSGACTSCQGRVVTGEIEHDDQSTVDDEMLAAGYACTCVAYPASDVTLLTHQMDNFEAGVTDPVNGAAAAPAPAAPAPAPVAAAPVAAAPVAAAAAPVDDWAVKRPIALQTLDVLAVTVAGRADLEAKIGELRALTEVPAPVNGVAAPVAAEVNGAAAPAAAAADPTAEYTPYFSKDTGYTIWLNKKRGLGVSQKSFRLRDGVEGTPVSRDACDSLVSCNTGTPGTPTTSTRTRRRSERETPTRLFAPPLA